VAAQVSEGDTLSADGGDTNHEYMDIVNRNAGTAKRTRKGE
jgi:hypothetical protein